MDNMMFRGMAINLSAVTHADDGGAGYCRPGVARIPDLYVHFKAGGSAVIHDCTVKEWGDALNKHTAERKRLEKLNAV